MPGPAPGPAGAPHGMDAMARHDECPWEWATGFRLCLVLSECDGHELLAMRHQYLLPWCRRTRRPLLGKVLGADSSHMLTAGSG